MKKHDFAIIGGDKRISYSAQILADKGYSVICYGVTDIENPKENIDPKGWNNPAEALKTSNLSIAASLKEAVWNSSTILCGIPFAKNGFLYVPSEKISLQELQRSLRKKQKLFAGMIPVSFKQTCEDRQIACMDFMTDESFIMQGAALTAEGVLLEALLHKNTGLHKSNLLITGYGRCGSILADKCRGLHANVTICDSSIPALAQAAAFGFSTLTPGELPVRIHDFEYLFHTAPALVYTKELLASMRPDSLLIDIASDRVGVDYEAASRYGRNVLYCPGLPGKYAPLSCAEQITEYVLSHISIDG